MTYYVALIDGESGAFGLVVPDPPDGASAGGAVEEALRNAAEAAPLWRDDARTTGSTGQQSLARRARSRRIASSRRHDRSQPSEIAEP